MTTNKGKVIIFSSPGGGGKNTIIKNYVTSHADTKFAVNYTSRKMRLDDIEGKTYFFVSREKFEQMIKNQDFFEYVEFCGNYYGTSKKFILDNIETNNNIMLQIEFNGAFNIKNQYNDAILVYILTPSVEVLMNRLISRSVDTRERIIERLTYGIEEVENAKKYDYLLINDDLNEVNKQIELIIKYEKNLENCTSEEIKIVENLRINSNINQQFIDSFIQQLKNIK